MKIPENSHYFLSFLSLLSVILKPIVCHSQDYSLSFSLKRIVCNFQVSAIIKRIYCHSQSYFFSASICSIFLSFDMYCLSFSSSVCFILKRSVCLSSFSSCLCFILKRSVCLSQAVYVSFSNKVSSILKLIFSSDILATL